MSDTKTPPLSSLQPRDGTPYEQEDWKSAPSRETTHDDPAGLNPALAAARRRRENAPLGAHDIPREETTSQARLLSPGFAEGDWLPQAHTADGAHLSPPLRWQGLPAATRSLVILLEGSDGGDDVHWLVYNLPPEPPFLPAGAGNAATDIPRQPYPERAHFLALPYRAPEPTPKTRTYCFRLFALDAPLAMTPDNAKPRAVLDAARDHVLATAELRVRYGRVDKPESEMF